MSNSDFKNNREEARRIEKFVASELQKMGWFIIPTYDFSGQDDEKAPRLQGAYEGFILPDLDMMRSGERQWGEVKFKAVPTLHRLSDTWEHGIPRRHFDDYLKVQDISGAKVWLYVFEECTEEILYASLDALVNCTRFYHGNKMSGGGMAFFPREKFRRLLKYNEQWDCYV